MKKIFLLFLCAATCFANFAAEAFLRVDVDGTAGKNTLTPTAGETMSISRSWQNAKENLKYTLRARTVEKLSGEWKTVQFSFTPQATGTLKVRLGGLWTKEEKERAWVLVDRIEQDGAMIEKRGLSEERFDREKPAGPRRYHTGEKREIPSRRREGGFRRSPRQLRQQRDPHHPGGSGDAMHTEIRSQSRAGKLIEPETRRNMMSQPQNRIASGMSFAQLGLLSGRSYQKYILPHDSVSVCPHATAASARQFHGPAREGLGERKRRGATRLSPYRPRHIFPGSQTRPRKFAPARPPAPSGPHSPPSPA
ncbi:MAG: hypothetical protein L6W00_15865 [Lentisphaeria bacterium]|nr:MAG: hypothetical protein L6W00_15865 [Lentisphaeria bacterium]